MNEVADFIQEYKDSLIALVEAYDTNDMIGSEEVLSAEEMIKAMTSSINKTTQELFGVRQKLNRKQRRIKKRRDRRHANKINGRKYKGLYRRKRR